MCGGDDNSIVHPMSPERLPVPPSLSLHRGCWCCRGSWGYLGTPGSCRPCSQQPRGEEISDLQPQAAQPHSSEEPGRRAHATARGQGARCSRGAPLRRAALFRPTSGQRAGGDLRRGPSVWELPSEGAQVPCSPAARLVKSQKGQKGQKGQKPRELAMSPPCCSTGCRHQAFPSPRSA